MIEKKRSESARVDVFKDEEKQRLVKLKGHRILSEELNDAVEKLSEDRRSLGVTRILNVEPVTVTSGELMPKATELFLD